MSKKAAEEQKTTKTSKPPKGPAPDDKPKKAKKEPAPDAAAEKAKADTAAIEKEKAKAAEPRPPADPRLKVLKKFHGKFLPRGPLRDRHKELMQRWDSGEDHGGVTVEELKSLHRDWVASRAKPTKTPAGMK
jgi:hypothetical protein